jgi:NTE family protein
MGSPSTRSSALTPALVLGGGGARTAYQAGVLRYLGEAFPAVPFPIVTASGTGALNAALLAGRAEPWPRATREGVEAWTALRPDRVVEPRPLWDLLAQLVRHAPSPKQSLLDPAPLRRQLADRLPVGPDGTLSGVRRTVADGWLEAMAVTTTHYGSLRTVTWTQGRALDGWSHGRRGARTDPLTIDHVMAAQALVLLYPAVSIDGEWHGAGVGMLHPLSPALRLGADRILALSTRPATVESPEAEEEAYPSPLQAASVLSNTLLEDTIAADAATLGRINRLVRPRPPDEREGLDPAEVLVLRPSVDLTTVAEGIDVEVDAALGTVLRYLHGEGTHLPDLLSMLLYEPAYLRRLLLLGYVDAQREHDRIERLLRP